MGERITFNYIALADALQNAASTDDLYRAIVDAPFEFKIEAAHLSLGIVVLLLADKKSGVINRVALSNTELAKGTTDVSVKRFEEIIIPLDHHENVISRVIAAGEPQLVTDWHYLFTPALTPEEARFNQAGGAIACSAVYPLDGVGDGGAMIFSFYQYPENIGQPQQTFMREYTHLVATILRGGRK